MSKRLISGTNQVFNEGYVEQSYNKLQSSRNFICKQRTKYFLPLPGYLHHLPR